MATLENRECFPVVDDDVVVISLKGKKIIKNHLLLYPNSYNSYCHVNPVNDYIKLHLWVIVLKMNAVFK